MCKLMPDIGIYTCMFGLTISTLIWNRPLAHKLQYTWKVVTSIVGKYRTILCVCSAPQNERTETCTEISSELVEAINVRYSAI